MHPAADNREERWMLPFLTKLWRAVRWFLNLSCKLHTHCPQMLLIGHSFLPFYQLCCVPLDTCKHLKTLFKLRTAHSILSEARPMVNVWESPLEWLVVLCLMHPRIDSDWDCCQPALLSPQSKPVCSTTLFLWKRTAFFAGPGDFSQLMAFVQGYRPLPWAAHTAFFMAFSLAL